MDEEYEQVEKEARFGYCKCGCELHAEWFQEEEMVNEGGYMRKTGRIRTNVNILSCPRCFREYCDDGSSNAGPWHY